MVVAKNEGRERFEVDTELGSLVAHCDPDFRAERDFEEACNRMLMSEKTKLLIDLAAARYISSSCLGTLFLLHQRAKLRGKHVHVRAHKSIFPVCKLMGLHNFITFDVVE
jgi:anti-anti-sigma regulatory factor